jgi:hypothetical protein
MTSSSISPAAPKLCPVAVQWQDAVFSQAEDEERLPLPQIPVLGADFVRATGDRD